MMHLSRLSEEIILWCSWEFKYLVPRHHFAAAEHAVPGQKVNVLLQNERGQRVCGGGEVCKPAVLCLLHPALPS